MSDWQTIDFFTPIVDDPADWGRIAAANALSDVYAMGGRPLFAVNLAAWPGEGLDLAILGQVLRGGAEVAAQAGCFVAGGHTIDDPVPKYGLAVTGLADPARLMTIDRATPGDQLILTKAIGTGVVATALKGGQAPEDVVTAAVASMTLLNAGASQAALQAGVEAHAREAAGAREDVAPVVERANDRVLIATSAIVRHQPRQKFEVVFKFFGESLTHAARLAVGGVGPIRAARAFSRSGPSSISRNSRSPEVRAITTCPASRPGGPGTTRRGPAARS